MQRRSCEEALAVDGTCYTQKRMIGARIGEVPDCDRVDITGAAEGMAFSARRQFMQEMYQQDSRSSTD